MNKPSADRGKTRWQFSLRAMLWAVGASAVILLAYREGPLWAPAVGGMGGGATLLLASCLNPRQAPQQAAQLLLGAAGFFVCCGVMFLAAYVRWVNLNSGTLDYATFAAVLFAFCYGVWCWNTTEEGAKFRAQLGYYAWIGGTLILNHLLFHGVIRHLR